MIGKVTSLDTTEILTMLPVPGTDSNTLSRLWYSLMYLSCETTRPVIRILTDYNALSTFVHAPRRKTFYSLRLSTWQLSVFPFNIVIPLSSWLPSSLPPGIESFQSPFLFVHLLSFFYDTLPTPFLLSHFPFLLTSLPSMSHTYLHSSNPSSLPTAVPPSIPIYTIPCILPPLLYFSPIHSLAP